MGSIYTTITRNEITSTTLEIMTPTIPALLVGSIYAKQLQVLSLQVLLWESWQKTESCHHIPWDLRLPSYGHLRLASRPPHSCLRASGFVTTWKGASKSRMMWAILHRYSKRFDVMNDWQEEELTRMRWQFPNQPWMGERSQHAVPKELIWARDDQGAK